MSGSPQYTGTNWALTGVAGGLTLGRLAIRGYNSRRLFWDDLVHCIALAVLIAHGFTNSITADAKVQLATANAKHGTPQATILNLDYHVRYLNTINNCLLYMVFWIVKVSFLLFYWFIFSTSRPFKIAWWIVTTATLLTFWVPIAGVLATCNNAHTVAEFKACNSATQARATKLEYSCAINVVTDIAIMMLPLWMLKDLKVQKYQKVGLAFIFSLATVCVVLDIVRTAEALASNQALYTILEINFVVIISCLPTYRVLLNFGKGSTKSSPSGYGSTRKSSVLSLKLPRGLSSWKRMDNSNSPKSEKITSLPPREADLESGIELGVKGSKSSAANSEQELVEPLDLTQGRSGRYR